MAIQVEHVGDVAVVTPQHWLHLLTKTDELEATLKKLILEQGEKTVLVNLTYLEHINEDAVGQL